MEYCDTANLDIWTASNISLCAIIAAFVIYLMSQNCKIADNELELYDVSEESVVSEEHNNESLHKDYYALVTKPHTTSKV